MNNTEYNITYKRKLSESYQVVTFEKGKLKIHELEMLRRNQLAGFLPIEFMLADGKGQFWYNITGLQSLEDLRKSGRFHEETLKNLVEGLDRILRTVEQYALREEGIQFSEIFFSTDGTRVFFGYLPLKTGVEEAAREQWMQLLDGLIKTAEYRDNDYVTYLFSLYEALGRENAGIATLREIPLRPVDTLLEKEEETLLVGPDKERGGGKREENKYFSQTITEERIGEQIKNEVMPGEEEAPSGRIMNRMKEAVKNKYLDGVWAVKKKMRQYTRLKPEKWEEVTLIQPEEQPEENRNTEYLGQLANSGNDGDESAEMSDNGGSSTRKHVGWIRFEDPAKESMPLTQSRYVVGKRKEYANLIVEDASVSRVHALIVREEDGYYLEDLNSLNGTFLNGALLELKEKVRLKSRDEIGVGHSTLFFEET